MSDIQNFMTYENHAKALAQANTLNKTVVFDALATAGVTTVTAAFDGEGDSGQIEGVSAFIDEKPQRVPDASIRFHHVSWGSLETTASEISLYEAIKSLCYDYLSQEHGGWENNDGGYGEFTFHVADRRIDLDFNQRFTDSTHHSHTF
jgi:hypothetical protein